MIIVPIAERLVKDKGTVIGPNGTRVIYMNNQCLCDSVTEAVDKLEEQVTNIPSKIYHTYAEKEKEEARNRILEFHEIAKEQFEKHAEVVKDLPNKIYSHIVKDKEETTNRMFNEMSNLFQKFQEITDEHIEKLGTNLKETLDDTHQHFEKETRKVKSKVNIEIDSVNYRLQDNSKTIKHVSFQILNVFAFLYNILFFCLFVLHRVLDVVDCLSGDCNHCGSPVPL